LNKFKIEKSKDGLDILVVNERYINSKFAPLCEASNIVYSGKNLICIFGLGLGYGLHNILKNNPESIIIVYEPIGELLLLYKERYINHELLDSRDILFLNSINEEKIYSFVEDGESFSEGRVYYHSNLGYKSLFQEDETLFFETIKDVFKIITQNTLTESNFIPVWTKNFIQNSQFFKKHPLLNPILQNLDKNLAIIACAGPNLDNDIKIIKNHRDKITLFAVDTALKPLLAYNIYPDFVVSLDGQFYSLEDFIQISDRENEGIFFIFDVLAYPPAVRLNKNVYFTTTENIFKNSIVDFFFTKNNITKFGLATGGTVSDYALSFALRLGFTNIYMAGLDLSFPYLTTHCLNSPYYERVMRSHSYFDPPESNIFRSISKRKLKNSISKNGNKNLISDFVLENYALYIENFVKINKFDNIYNSKHHSLEIKGLKNIELDKLLDMSTSKRIFGDKLVKNSTLITLSEEKLKVFYQNLLNDLYESSLKIKEILENSNFNEECSILVKNYDSILKDLLNKFPFLKKFTIMTTIILDKKNITHEQIIYYKHIFFKIIQSIYYVIRIIQKILKLI